jgi:hypothetical protein
MSAQLDAIEKVCCSLSLLKGLADLFADHGFSISSFHDDQFTGRPQSELQLSDALSKYAGQFVIVIWKKFRLLPSAITEITSASRPRG